MIQQAGHAVLAHQLAQATETLCPYRHGEQQFGIGNRFAQKVIRARLHGLLLTIHARLSGQKYNRQAEILRILPNHPRHFQAGILGHVQIHQHQLGLVFRQILQRLFRITQTDGIHAGHIQALSVMLRQHLVVIHHQNTIRGCVTTVGHAIQMLIQRGNVHGLGQISHRTRLHRRQTRLPIPTGGNHHTRGCAQGLNPCQQLHTGQTPFRQHHVHNQRGMSQLRQGRQHINRTVIYPHLPAQQAQLGGQVLCQCHIIIHHPDHITDERLSAGQQQRRQHRLLRCNVLL